MKPKRRRFIKQVAGTIALGALSPRVWPTGSPGPVTHQYQSKPWIEISRANYMSNASLVSKMSRGKAILAVLKNNAYGLGDVEVAQVLDQSSHVFGMAVVKDDCALAMRAAGVTKPILLMGDFEERWGLDLTRADVTLSIHSYSSFEKILQIGQEVDRPVGVALYIDTGLGRMGIPWEEAFALATKVANQPNMTIVQTFSTLTTPTDFAAEQIDRFRTIISKMNQNGIGAGVKHLAPSYSLLDLSSSHQDVVRPGILLHGSFPMAHMEEANQYPLEVAYRLKAPIIRLEKLQAGDSIGFSRFYSVTQDEWIATLPIGWADGYDSGAENGAKVLLGDRLYPVVNVNASHTNIALGSNTSFQVGDVATLIGPEAPDITPEGFAKLIGGHNYLQINYKESIPKHVYDNF